jgi:hypothetical protein
MSDSRVLSVGRAFMHAFPNEVQRVRALWITFARATARLDCAQAQVSSLYGLECSTFAFTKECAIFADVVCLPYDGEFAELRADGYVNCLHRRIRPSVRPSARRGVHFIAFCFVCV